MTDRARTDRPRAGWLTPRRAVAVAAAVVVTAVLAVVLVGRGGGEAGGDTPFWPDSYSPPVWEQLLGGDQALDAGVWGRLAESSDLPAEDTTALVALAETVTVAEATGDASAVGEGYLGRSHPVVAPPPRPPSGAEDRACRDVRVLGTAPTSLPAPSSRRFAKVLVAWEGTCPFSSPLGDAPRITYVYAEQRADGPAGSAGWVPVRALEIPGAALASRGVPEVPASWEIDALTGCAQGQVLARLDVVAAWQVLCADATSAGVALRAVDGLRSPEDQAALFDEAATRFGGSEEARRRIAYSDGSACWSRHCSGEAVDVAADAAVLSWLNEQVGCQGADGVVALGTGPCGAGSPIPRAARYGFAIPWPRTNPTHLEYAIGTMSSSASVYGDCSPGPVAVVEMVRAIFTCRAVEAGLAPEVAKSVAEEAVAVARCTSQLNPSSQSYGGRYSRSANPVTGVVDDRAGVFGLSSAVAEAWVDGGAAGRADARANIDAAARIWTHERGFGRWGWDPFACAAADDGTTTVGVLNR